jgi:Fic family protein
MRREDFSDRAPGALVRLGEDGALAYIPNRLPPPIAITRDLLLAVESARGMLGELTGQARLVENLDLVTASLARREAVLSSRIEGTQTEIVEVVLQEAGARPPASEDSDLHEVLNYRATVDLATGWLTDGRALGLPFAKDLHARLLKGTRGEEKRPGALRASNVYIGSRAEGFAGARFVPPPVEHVEPLLDDLFAFIKADTYGPLIDAAIAHYQFETIHPFEDGNGRLGRLLIPLHLQSRDVIDRPLLYLGPYLEAHSDEYRDGLFAVSTGGTWEAWIAFFLRAIRESSADALSRVDRIVSLQRTYRERLARVSSSSFAAPALDLVLRQVVVSVRDLSDRLERHPAAPTSKAVIDDLVEAKILQPFGRLRGRQYWIAREVFEAAYAD